MPNLADQAVVRKNVMVKVPIERAFSVFVEQMETWWPATHHIGKTPFEAIFDEPRVGGRWYERDAEGHTTDWAGFWPGTHPIGLPSHGTSGRGMIRRIGYEIQIRRKPAK